MTDERARQLLSEMATLMQEQQVLLQTQQAINNDLSEQNDRLVAALWYFFMVGFQCGARWNV